MNDESQKPAQDLNKIDFPDSLFGENKPVEPSGLTTPPPAAPDDSRRNLGIVLAIVTILCCLIVALGAGGYYLINESSRAQNAQNTVTAAAIAQSVATNQAYAKGTLVAQATQSQATAMAQATLEANLTVTAAAQVQATAAAQAALDANTTATVIAHQTERANYPFIETFDNNKKAWATGKSDSELYAGTKSVENGAYIWDITGVKETFITWENYKSQKALGDFDVSVDGMLKAGDPANYCYGFMFREAPEGFEHGAYVFDVCESGSFETSYYNKADGWQQISGWQTSDAIKAGDWNRIEISARGSHFVFTVNDVQIFAMDDSRQATGYLSVMLDVLDKSPGTVWFDNFGLQTH